MKKYFITSDIHSFGDILEKDLLASGFDINNEDHILVICGDVFDRGEQTIKTYKFITSIPKKRRILIYGNHEQLYFDLLEKDFPERHDFSNGTVRTFCEIANEVEFDYYSRFFLTADDMTYENLWKKIKNKVKKHKITKWLMSDEWKDYFEIDNYVCVHSFIPLQIKNSQDLGMFKYWPIYEINPKQLEVIPEWRTNAKFADWRDARWVCPWQLFKEGLFDKEKENGKTLVCGHWHASDFFEGLDNEQHSKYDGEMYNNNGIIGLDACTVLSGKINILIIEK